MLTRCDTSALLQALAGQDVDVIETTDMDGTREMSFLSKASGEVLGTVEFTLRDGKTKVQQAFRRA